MMLMISKQKQSHPGQLPKCFTCNEETVTIAREKLKKGIETLMKGHFYTVNISDTYFGTEGIVSCQHTTMV